MNRYPTYRIYKKRMLASKSILVKMSIVVWNFLCYLRYMKCYIIQSISWFVLHLIQTHLCGIIILENVIFEIFAVISDLTEELFLRKTIYRFPSQVCSSRLTYVWATGLAKLTSYWLSLFSVWRFQGQSCMSVEHFSWNFVFILCITYIHIVMYQLQTIVITTTAMNELSRGIFQFWAIIVPLFLLFGYFKGKFASFAWATCHSIAL